MILPHSSHLYKVLLFIHLQKFRSGIHPHQQLHPQPRNQMISPNQELHAHLKPQLLLVLLVLFPLWVLNAHLKPQLILVLFVLFQQSSHHQVRPRQQTTIPRVRPKVHTAIRKVIILQLVIQINKIKLYLMYQTEIKIL